jgi:hypothetical protein
MNPKTPPPARPVILLDLVCTLVANHDECWYIQSIEARMAKERYRDWLVTLLRPYYVILVTARTADLRDATLANIRRKAGWSPQEAYFNPAGLRPHDLKALVLTQSVWPAHGQHRAYFAIESNETTRSMYTRHGVPALPVPADGSVWDHIPHQPVQTEMELSAMQNPTVHLEPREAAPGELIVLLDLNYTLVANQRATRHLRPFRKRLEHEEYRGWLVDLVAKYFTIMVTARPVHQMLDSLANIRRKTGWSPQEAHFIDRPYGVERPHQFKRRVLTARIWPRYGRDRPYFAPESNPRTRAMYAEHNIPAQPVPDQGPPWTALPPEKGGA